MCKQNRFQDWGNLARDINDAEFKPMGAALGADVLGLDVNNVSADDAVRLRQGFLDFLVLRLRGTDLDDGRFLNFARVLVSWNYRQRLFLMAKGGSGSSELSQVSNKKVAGKNIGSLSNVELVWHTDMSYIETPPTASLLYALELPSSGGDTSFLNMYSAYEKHFPEV